jgi:hypothetical protein
MQEECLSGIENLVPNDSDAHRADYGALGYNAAAMGG